MAKKTKKQEPSPPQPEGQEKPLAAPTKGSENAPKEPAAPPERKFRSMRAKLKGIIKQNLDAMPGRIPEAPLNQLTTNAEFAFKQIEKIDYVRAIADSEPLYFSRLSDEQLKAFFRLLLAVLSRNCNSHLRGRRAYLL